MIIVVDKAECVGCEECLQAKIIQHTCDKCERCIPVCPVKAIKMVSIRLNESKI